MRLVHRSMGNSTHSCSREYIFPTSAGKCRIFFGNASRSPRRSPGLELRHELCVSTSRVAAAINATHHGKGEMNGDGTRPGFFELQPSSRCSSRLRAGGRSRRRLSWSFTDAHFVLNFQNDLDAEKVVSQRQRTEAMSSEIFAVGTEAFPNTHSRQLIWGISRRSSATRTVSLSRRPSRI